MGIIGEAVVLTPCQRFVRLSVLELKPRVPVARRAGESLLQLAGFPFLTVPERDVDRARQEG
jgi:hypothetical protein